MTLLAACALIVVIIASFHQPSVVDSQVCYWCQGANYRPQGYFPPPRPPPWQQAPSPWQPVRPQQQQPNQAASNVQYRPDGTCTATCKAEAYCLGWSSTPSIFGADGTVFRDVDVGDAAQHIKNELDACRAYIELYVEEPVHAANMSKVIQDAFYATAKERKQNENGLKASTFHCCHMEYARELIPPPAPEQLYAEIELPKDVTCKSLVETLFNELRPDAPKSNFTSKKSKIQN